MFEGCFEVFSFIDALFWRYIGFVLIVAIGCYFTVISKGFQMRSLRAVMKAFRQFASLKEERAQGTHPLKVFFASTGGMIGLGNIVGIVTAVQIGGPGAIFWVWIAGLLGSVIKYSEVFLGLKFRVRNQQGGYDGGSIHFIRRAFKARWISGALCVLLCIYGVEIYQFSVLTHTLSINWGLNHLLVVIAALGIVIYTITGGIQRIGKICAALIPLFTLVYLGMCLWVIALHAPQLPSLLLEILKGAFSGQGALGGFAGSSVLLAMQQGVSRAIYSTDIGIGYDSIIQSETSTTAHKSQARLAILGVAIDNTICSMTLLVALCTGLWKAVPAIDSSFVIQKACALHFPASALFMSFFITLLAYSTIISYLYAGLKSARHLHKRLGEKIYLVIGPALLFGFAFLDQSRALLVMSLSGCLLVTINMLGIFRLRKEIDFSLEDERVLNATDLEQSGIMDDPLRIKLNVCKAKRSDL